jgi:hypothetical protein
MLSGLQLRWMYEYCGLSTVGDDVADFFLSDARSEENKASEHPSYTSISF